jgi:uncharacterized protein
VDGIMAIDFEGARQYALGRLEHELSPTLTYHCLEHTSDDVVPAAERLAEMEGVAGEPLTLLLTAAYYHDIGFIERHLDNEVIAVRIAEQVLPGFGYDPAQVQTISGIILATRLPQTPHTLLEEIIGDADLDGLGRSDFMIFNHNLRAEWAAFGKTYTDEEWYHDQIAFLQGHRYFTRAAQSLRDAGQQENLAQVKALFEASQAKQHAS